MLSKITVTVAIVTLMIENENSYVLHPTFLAYFFQLSELLFLWTANKLWSCHPNGVASRDRASEASKRKEGAAATRIELRRRHSLLVVGRTLGPKLGMRRVHIFLNQI